MKYKGNLKTAIFVGTVLLMAAGCNKAAQNNSDNSAQNQVTQNIQSTPAPTPTPTPSMQVPKEGGTLEGDLHFSGENDAIDKSPEVVEVDITSSGFSPSSITVHAGDYVQFVNKDSAPHWPASNPHPTHTDLPGFDAKKALATGGTYRFQFVKVGTWGYHDHMNPATHGQVVVQP
jgi:plastocyanin